MVLHALPRLVDAVEQDGVVDAVDGDDRRAGRVPHDPPAADAVALMIMVQLLVEVIWSQVERECKTVGWLGSRGKGASNGNGKSRIDYVNTYYFCQTAT